MSESKQTVLVFVSTLTVSALGLALVAQAQSVPSPFAKKGKQAWETGNSGTTDHAQPQPYQYPYGSSTTPSQPAAPSPYPPSSYSSGSPVPVISSQPSPTPSSSYTYTLPKPSTSPAGSSVSSGGSPYPSTYGGSPAPQGQYQPQTQTQQSYTQQSYTQPSHSQASQGASYDYPSYNRAPSTGQTNSQSSGAYYPGRVNGGQTQPVLRGSRDRAQGTYYPQQAQTSYPTPNPYGTPNQLPKRTLSQKLGLNNIDVHYEGYVAGGAAGTYFDDLTVTDREWREDFVFDGLGLVEVSAITPGGLEYGVAAELRGQYDPYRRGFGGRVGDCPPDIAGCSGVLVGGQNLSVRGHTSRFYSSGADDAKDFQAQLEGAHIFLRSAYGDVTVGRDDGAAYLFSLGAPTLLNVGASNSSVDYTGLDAVKTVNDASGFAEKITYTSPRLLGDQIGVGIQIGASYALDAKACGVDYCVRGVDDEPTGVIASDLDNIVEFGLALDRKFENGLSVEATATYAMGSQQNQVAAFDDLKSLGLALELGYGDFVLGGSYLSSNNALADGDYTAWDAGLTWQPSKFGVTLGYGQAEDKNVGLTSDQAVAGVSYDFNDMFRLGTGVQYVKRDVNLYNVTTMLTAAEEEEAASVFVEGRIKF